MRRRAPSPSPRTHVAAAALAGAILVAGACSRLRAPGGSAGAGGDGGPPVAGGAAEHPGAGLVSALPAETSLRVDWRVSGFETGQEPPLLLFVGTDEGDLFDTTPIPLARDQRSALLTGLDTEREHFAALALDAGGDAVPLRPTLRARTGAPLYVDASAAPGGDGSSPGRALDDLGCALLAANAAGGGNLFLVEGSYPGVALDVPPGVHVYGGFAPGFLLAERDAALHPARLSAAGGTPILTLPANPGGSPTVLDGLTLDGLGTAAAGIEVVETSAELRALTSTNCRRGVALRGALFGAAPLVRLVASDLTQNAVQGLSLTGVFSLEVVGCSLSGNGQEGLDANDLVAPTVGEVSIVAHDSRFSSNAAEGVDIDLAPGFGAGVAYRVELEDCDFEANGLAGARVDMDFEGAPDHSARISLIGVRARANGGNGLEFDLDAVGSAFVHRSLSSANGGHGLLAGSESQAGLLLVSASVLSGNAGLGASAIEGNWSTFLSHCIIAGNAQGGLVSQVVEASVVSNVAYLQPVPWTGTRVSAGLETAQTRPTPFVHAPIGYATVTAILADGVQLASTRVLGIGANVEFADDDLPRTVTAVSGAFVGLDPPPGPLPLPTGFAWFPAAPLPSVSEAWDPGPGSALVGAGLPLPSGAPVDAGPFGSPAGGAPGLFGLGTPSPFRVASIEPPPGQPIDAFADIVLGFEGGAPAPERLPAAVRAAAQDGSPRSVIAVLDGARVRVSAPSGGWLDGDVLELHSVLRSTTGQDLAATVVVPVRL